MPADLECEVEDRSTNGTFVNDTRLSKGQRLPLNDGDILSLTKPGAEGDDGGLGRGCGGGVRFRLDLIMPSPSSGGMPLDVPREMTREAQHPEAIAPAVSSGVRIFPSRDAFGAVDVPAHSLQVIPPPCSAALAAVGAACSTDLEKNLLLLEQESKAKITGELVQVRRSLDREREASAKSLKEAQKARGMLEAERAKRGAAFDTRERLQAEVEHLRLSRKQAETLRSAHEALQTKHEKAEIELGTQLQRCTSLNTRHEGLQAELERAKVLAAQDEPHLAEVQASLQQAQERVESAQAKYQEVRQKGEEASQELDRLKRELGCERDAREQLEDQVTLLHSDVDRSDRSKQEACTALHAITKEHSELEARIVAWKAEAESSRLSAQETQMLLKSEADQVDALGAGASRIADSIRAYVESWARGLNESSQEAYGAVFGPAYASAVLVDRRGDCGKATVAAERKRVFPPEACADGSEYRDEKPVDDESDNFVDLANSKVEEHFKETAHEQRDREDSRRTPSPMTLPRLVGASHGEAAVQEFAALRPPPPASGMDVKDEVEGPQQSQFALAAEALRPELAANQNVLSLMVGSQDSPLPPLGPPPADVEFRGVQEASDANMEVHGQQHVEPEVAGAKRSSTWSILVMPGMQPTFKRARPATVR